MVVFRKGERTKVRYNQKESQQREYEHQLHSDRLSTLLYSVNALVERHSVKLESLIADYGSLRYTVSGKQSVDSNPTVQARVTKDNNRAMAQSFI